jgi:hypothetical protein
VRPSYATAVLGSAPPIEGIFDDIGRGLSNAVKAVTKPVADAVDAVDKAYVSVTPQWLRKAVGAPFGGAKFVWDAADSVAKGERIDRALLSAAKDQVAMFRAVAPIAQLGLSFIPGVGQGVSAAIGAGLALADGKPITDALLSGLKSAIPGGPLVQKAVEMGIHGAVDLASGKRLDAVALDAVRQNLPGGETARAAFDAGLALAQGKRLQEAGMAAAGHLVPNNPLAHGAFEMTKRALAGRPLTGSTHTAMTRLMALHRPPVPRPAPRRAPPPHPAPIRAASHAVHPLARTEPAHAPVDFAPEPGTSSHALPIALGIGALAAAGGGAWWWWRQRQKHAA